MDRTKLTILLIEDSPEFADLVRHWIVGSSGEPALTFEWTATLDAGLHRLAEGGVDVILLDLGLPDSSGFATFTATITHTPKIPIVILSANDSEAIALRAIQEGAEDYLVKSMCSPEVLLRTVRHAVVRHKSHDGKGDPGTSSNRTRVLGILGAQGGVGATTVACNLAVELRRQSNQTVLLTGLDLRADLVSFLMGLHVKYSMRDAADNLDRLDNNAYWQDTVTRGPDDLDVLPSTGALRGGDLPANVIGRVLNQIKPFYRWIVLDLGRLNERSTSLLESVSDAFVVTTNALSSLYEVKRLIFVLREAGIEEARVGLIVNEIVEARFLPDTELTTIFGVQTYARLSGNRDALEKACLGRRLPDKTTNIRQQIAALARSVAGLPEPASQQKVS